MNGSHFDQVVSALAASGEYTLSGGQETPTPAPDLSGQSAQNVTPDKPAVPPPVPYERFKESRHELKQAKAERDRLAEELKQLKERAASTEPASEDDWLADIFGKEPAQAARSESAGVATPSADPVMQAIREEYGQRQLDLTLAKYQHIPEDVMLAGLAQNLTPAQVEQAFTSLTALMGNAKPARPAPPPRPSSGAAPSTPPSPPRPKLPDDSYSRVDFVANLLRNQAG